MLHLHGLEVQLALQVADAGFLPADDGALGRALLQARRSRLRCLQLGEDGLRYTSAAPDPRKHLPVPFPPPPPTAPSPRCDVHRAPLTAPEVMGHDGAAAPSAC